MSVKALDGKSVLKKTLPLIITLLVIIGTAVTFSLIPNEKPIPQISNPEAAFATIGGKAVTNQQIYNDLRGTMGLQEIVDYMDRILLANYLTQVTEQMVTDALNKAIFQTSDLSGFTSTEITERTQAFFDNQYLSGFTTEASVRDYYRLQEAKRLYTRVQYVSYIAETETSTQTPFYTATKYQDYFNANYKPNVNALILKYSTANEAKLTLQEFGMMTSTENTNKLVQYNADKDAPEVALSPEDISKNFIAMYNQLHGYKVVDGIPLKEDVHYTITDGKVLFTTQPVEKFVGWNHKYIDLNKTNASLANHVFNTLQLPDDTNNTTYDDTFYRSYSPSSRNYGGSFYLVLKFGVDPIVTLEQAQAEILEKFIDADITATRIDTEIKKLRIEAGLKLYDPLMEKTYTNYDSNFKVDKKAKSKTLVASFMNGDTKVELTVDELFERLANRSGVSGAVQHLNQLLLVNNTELNKIYDFANDKVLDKTKYDELKDQINQYKTAFAQDYFAQNGYPASMGWNNFISAFFGVDNETDLLHRVMIYGEVYQAFVKTTYDNTLLRTYMEDAVNKFFTASVLNLVITVDFDQNGTPDTNKIGEIDPEHNWTQAQKDLIPGLVTVVQAELDRLVTGTVTYKMAFDQIIVEYNNATRSDVKWGAYKLAGLNLKIEDLGTSSNNSSFVPEFLDQIKMIWDKVKADGNLGQNEFYWSDGAFETSFGFHYIGTYMTSDMSYADKANARVLPTNEEIDKYVADATDPDLTTAVKAAIAAYYTPAVAKAEEGARINIELAKARELADVNFTSALHNTIYARMVEISEESFNQ